MHEFPVSRILTLGNLSYNFWKNEFAARRHLYKHAIRLMHIWFLQQLGNFLGGAPPALLVSRNVSKPIYYARDPLCIHDKSDKATQATKVQIKTKTRALLEQVELHANNTIGTSSPGHALNLPALMSSKDK